jgi:hypothetical protein
VARKDEGAGEEEEKDGEVRKEWSSRVVEPARKYLSL